MTLGFARLAMASGDREALRRALGSARHLVDRDLHPRLGLPYRHGPGHRRRHPEPGHTWLTGLLWVACHAADPDLLDGARRIAQGLSGNRRDSGEGRPTRLRDTAWPLLELEQWLRFEDDRRAALAADRHAAELARRWDPVARAVRFAEGEGRHSYEQRLWLTGGILLPALRAHLRRRPSRRIEAVVSSLERRILTLVSAGKRGLPLRCWIRGGEVSHAARSESRAEGFMLLEGLSERGLQRALGRQQVQRALRGVPATGDPNLPTSFSIVARCSWLMR